MGRFFIAKPPAFIPALRLRSNSLWRQIDPELEAAIARNMPNRVAREHRYYVRLSNEYIDWSTKRGTSPLPVDTRELYKFFDHLRFEKHCGLAIMRKYLTAINAFQHSNGLPVSGTAMVLDILNDMKRTYKARQARPFTPQHVFMLCDHAHAVESRLVAARNMALFLVAFASACRPAELVALHVSDVVFGPEGATLYIRQSKTSRDGEVLHKRITRSANVQRCPVRALETWLRLSRMTSGPLFRGIRCGKYLHPRALTAGTFRHILKMYTTALSFSAGYSPYSFRRGLATSADKAGSPLEDIQQQLNHRQKRSTMIYIDQQPLAWQRVITSVVLP